MVPLVSAGGFYLISRRFFTILNPFVIYFVKQGKRRLYFFYFCVLFNRLLSIFA